MSSLHYVHKSYRNDFKTIMLCANDNLGVHLQTKIRISRKYETMLLLLID